jgi:hypothetical protein
MKSQQLLGVEMPIECEILRQKADPLLCPNVARSVTKNARPSVVSAYEPHENTHAGGLARPVGTEKCANFAPCYLKRNLGKGWYLGSGETPLISLAHIRKLYSWRFHLWLTFRGLHLYSEFAGQT